MNIGTGISSLPSQLEGLTPIGSPASSTSGSTFSDLFKSAIGSTDALQSGADSKISNLLQGAPNTDVSNVMVSVEKADVAFQLMMQVRNKVVNAYQDIAKMQF